MNKQRTLCEIDHAMAAKPANDNDITWYTPFEAPLQLQGFPWFDAEHKYCRLPIVNPPAQVTQYPNGIAAKIPFQQCGAYSLAFNTAGGQIRFRTDSTKFMLKGCLSGNYILDNMTFCGSAGFDIYLKTKDQDWQYYGITRKPAGKKKFSSELCSGLNREMRDVIINFPLYNGVKSVFVGLEKNAIVEKASPFTSNSPLVFYGTSITQGGCSSHPGNAPSNIIGRLLNRPTINCGFSGSGKGEPEIAEILSNISNPALYIIDYCWNVDVQELAATLPRFIDILRKRHPATPIILQSPTPGFEMLPDFAHPAINLAAMHDIMKNEAQARQLTGDKNIIFFDATYLFGNNFIDYTVDGCHLSDHGFFTLAKAMSELIVKI